MDLKSGHPFWAVKNGLMKAYPRLEADITADVVVVGGGITGALIADELSHSGKQVVVIEQREVGWGSTAASTALVQYEIDTHMVDLAKKFGEEKAALAYLACADAILQIEALAKSVGAVDFAMQDSLYLASSRWHVRAFRKEFALRARHGLDVEWFDSVQLEASYGIEAPCAILSHQAARVDPYRMAYGLLARVVRRGGAVFDRTVVAKIDPSSRGVALRTDGGCNIRAKHVVLAAGYANQNWLKQRVARNRSSYAFVSDPVDAQELSFLARTMVWESARPYLYLRSTGEGRVIVGGEDDPVDIPSLRDLRVEKKERALMEKTSKRLPFLSLRPAFAWAGTFAETEDGLPFFGPHEQYGPRVLFAMAYGGNGITYAMLGAGLIRALIERRKHPLAKLFSFERIR